MKANRSDDVLSTSAAVQAMPEVWLARHKVGTRS